MPWNKGLITAIIVGIVGVSLLLTVLISALITTSKSGVTPQTSCTPKQPVTPIPPFDQKLPVPYQFRIGPISVLHSSFSNISTRYPVRISWVGEANDNPTLKINGKDLAFSAATPFFGSLSQWTFIDSFNLPSGCVNTLGDNKVFDACKSAAGSLLHLRTTWYDLQYGRNKVEVEWTKSGTKETSIFEVTIPEIGGDIIDMHIGDPQIGFGSCCDFSKNIENGPACTETQIAKQFRDYAKNCHMVSLGGDIAYTPYRGWANQILHQSFQKLSDKETSTFYAKLLIACIGNHDYTPVGGSPDSGACGMIQFYPQDTYENGFTYIKADDPVISSTQAFTDTSKICIVGQNSPVGTSLGIYVVGKLGVVSVDNSSINKDDFENLPIWTNVLSAFTAAKVKTIMVMSHWNVTNLMAKSTTQQLRDVLAGLSGFNIFSVFYNSNHSHNTGIDVAGQGFDYSKNGMFGSDGQTGCQTCRVVPGNGSFATSWIKNNF